MELKKKVYINLHTRLILIMILTYLLNPTPGVSLADHDAPKKLEQEYTQKEKEKQITELLELGDSLAEAKDYNYALAAYEQVFLLDPNHRKASAKIDLLKKRMAHEGRDETGVVKAVYDEEAKERVRKLWVEVRNCLNKERFGQARFALEKILLLDPENQEAQKLYQDLKQKQFGKVS
ncbi:MAG: hypothetical protein HY582_02870 [Candidatus Omnitrophica bacterium]|nr:hypothetical protein [Candidatus Omnitrophota bacterium]